MKRLFCAATLAITSLLTACGGGESAPTVTVGAQVEARIRFCYPALESCSPRLHPELPYVYLLEGRVDVYVQANTEDRALVETLVWERMNPQQPKVLAAQYLHDPSHR